MTDPWVLLTAGLTGLVGWYAHRQRGSEPPRMSGARGHLLQWKSTDRKNF
jgi:hypothetical protein